MVSTELRSGRRRGPLVAVVLALVMSAAACGDDGGDPERPPEEVLAEAKQALDETSGVTLSLSTAELPEDVDGVLEATGVATRAPAFTGDLTLLVNGLEVDVPAVSVDGVVYAQLPFTKSFSEVDPADYGAPDPVDLFAPDTGISTWLAEVTDLEEGESVRDGELVLRSYTGSLSASVIDASIPIDDTEAEFPVTFQIDDTGLLRVVQVSGPFYGSDGIVDYTVGVDDYGIDQDIRKP